jgi:hypothetical protein
MIVTGLPRFFAPAESAGRRRLKNPAKAMKSDENGTLQHECPAGGPPFKGKTTGAPPPHIFHLICRIYWENFHSIESTRLVLFP